MNNLINLTTDFGLSDGFVGVLHGVILSINPRAHIEDISHGLPPQEILEGAFVLSNSVPYFPPAVHVCVVDPGVGSARRPIAIQVGQSFFVGPDNGVLSLAVQDMEAREHTTARAVELLNPRYRLPRVSNTFHGRDIFAPAAAHLSRGIPFEELGAPVQAWIRLAPPAPVRLPTGGLSGRVIYIDRFGNLITNIGDTDLAGLTASGTSGVRIEIAGRRLNGLARSYSDVAVGELAALIGSPWKLEIAEREGNAARTLGVRVGDEVRVTL